MRISLRHITAVSYGQALILKPTTVCVTHSCAPIPEALLVLATIAGDNGISFGNTNIYEGEVRWEAPYSFHCLTLSCIWTCRSLSSGANLASSSSVGLTMPV